MSPSLLSPPKIGQDLSPPKIGQDPRCVDDNGKLTFGKHLKEFVVLIRFILIIDQDEVNGLMFMFEEYLRSERHVFRRYPATDLYYFLKHHVEKNCMELRKFSF